MIPADLSGGAEGTRTPDPLHAMQVRYQLRHSPGLLLLFQAFSGSPPKQLKYLRTAIPKIPNREYSPRRCASYSPSEAAAAFAEASSPSWRSTTGQSFQRRSRA